MGHISSQDSFLIHIAIHKAAVKFKHVSTGSHLGEVMLAHSINPNIMSFELAQSRGRFLRVNDDAVVGLLAKRIYMLNDNCIIQSIPNICTVRILTFERYMCAVHCICPSRGLYHTETFVSIIDSVNSFMSSIG